MPGVNKGGGPPEFVRPGGPPEFVTQGGGPGRGKGRGLALGRNEEFRALKEAHKNGELEGPFGIALQELKSNLRAGPAEEVVSSEAASAVSEKAETSAVIESKLEVIVKSTEDGEANQQEIIEGAFADNAKFFET